MCWKTGKPTLLLDWSKLNKKDERHLTMGCSGFGLQEQVVTYGAVCYKLYQPHGDKHSFMEQMKITDEELVARAQGGDREAFGELVARHHGKAYSLALHMCLGDVQEAEDLTQEAFLRAFKNINNFRGDSSFYTWFFRIVVNTCLDGRKKRLKWENLLFWKRHRSEEEKGEDAEDLESHPDTMPGRDPMAALTQKRLTMEVKKALRDLPPRQRMALQLKVLEGMSLREIAELMGTAEGTVKSHLFRATHKLQEVLKDWV